MVEVAINFHCDLINTATFFSQFHGDLKSHQFIGEICSELAPMRAYRGEFVGNVGDPVQRWCIVQEGTVVATAALDPEIELKLFQYGESFGEVGIFFTQKVLVEKQFLRRFETYS